MAQEGQENLIKEVFLGALDMPAQERGEWLDRNCPASIREEVEALLKASDADAPTVTAEHVIRALPPDTAPSTSSIPPFTRLDEFRVLRKLGSGGMATVYLAEDTKLRRRVALKVLPSIAGLDDEASHRFQQEAITVAQLSHPVIVPVHRAGFASGMHFLAMEFVDGPTLASVIEEESSARGSRAGLSQDWIDQQTRIAMRIGEALEHAHQLNVVHRDVKPSNIMIDDGGVPRLTDFGIARNLRLESLTMTGQIAGTVAYMSPEQARAIPRGIDRRTDVYSLGVTLYEALTMRQAFTGDSFDEIRASVINRRPPPVRSLNSTVSRDLATVCEKAIEKEPRHRYQTAAHFAADLRCVLEDRPIMARPPGLVRRTRILVRERRRLVVMIVLLMLASTSAALGLAYRGKLLAERTPVILQADAPVQWAFRVADAEQSTWTPLGSASRKSTRFEPGLYLVRAIGDDGKTTEGGLFVAPSHASDADRVELRLRTARAPDRDGMVMIVGGTFSPSHLGYGVEVGDFLMDRTEVSNASYFEFVNATGHPRPFHWTPESGIGYDERLADRPVVGISLQDANAYAHWKGLRLPTEIEWEYAATRPNGATLPWGEGAPSIPVTHPGPSDLASATGDGLARWDRLLAMYETHTFDVASGTELATGLGLLHMQTNVREMTLAFNPRTQAVIARGGSWQRPVDSESLRSRTQYPWRSSGTDRGFRCVLPLPAPERTGEAGQPRG